MESSVAEDAMLVYHTLLPVATSTSTTMSWDRLEISPV